MFEKVLECVREGIKNHEYPSAAVAIGRHDELFLREIFGDRQAEPERHKADFETLYDMASMTKIISTAMITLRFVDEGKLCLFDSVGRYFPNSGAFKKVYLRDLMTHQSGLDPNVKLYEGCPSPSDAADFILSSAPICEKGTEVNYSCLGFILLGIILEKISGEPLDVLTQKYVFDPLGMSTACYNPKGKTDNCAATVFDEDRGEWMCGEVMDKNSRFMGGISGNAGIFATLDDIIKYSTMLSKRGEVNGERFLGSRIFNLAIKNYTEGKSDSRGLGLQIKGGGYSPMGSLLSEGSFGHAGFAGTSLYIDNATDVYAIFMTNAVHFGNDKAPYYHTRRCFYNLVVNECCRIYEK